MKTFTINIPTSFKEARTMLAERKSKRFKHNVQVLRKFADDVIAEVNSGYWANDISDTMKRKVFNGVYGKIAELYRNAKTELK